LGLGNVVLYSFTGNIPNTPEKLSWTPETSFSKISSKASMLFKDSVSRNSFKQLKRFANTHCVRNFNKQVYIIRLYIKFINLKTILRNNISQYFLAKNPKLLKLKRIHSVFAFPHKVKCILSNSMPKLADFHFFSSYAKFFKKAQTTLNMFGACANFVAHVLFSLQDLRTYRRFSLPCTKSQGILRM